jgi:hypothetical protein
LGQEQQDAAIDVYRSMGYNDWVRDEALYVGSWEDNPVECRAHLAFNYQAIMGNLELEFFWYSDGESPMIARASGRTDLFISHMSAYVNDVDEIAAGLSDSLGEPYYKRETHDHQNAHVKGIKRFREYVWNTHEVIGYDLKIIQRISHEDDDERYRKGRQDYIDSMFTPGS